MAAYCVILHFSSHWDHEWQPMVFGHGQGLYLTFAQLWADYIVTCSRAGQYVCLLWNVDDELISEDNISNFGRSSSSILLSE